MASAQRTDPVLMTINGKIIKRSAFEYSLNKNHKDVQRPLTQKEVEAYLPLYIDYQLKVDAAERAGLDTLSSFRQEFLTYRDRQLYPFLIDSVFVDSVAHDVFLRMKEELHGKDLLLPAHILIRVGQRADEKEWERAQHKADSICEALAGGADFGQLAREYSDDRASAEHGGKIGWIGPQQTLEEFEQAAYGLNVGERSSAVLSPLGIHIIYMVDRKKWDSFAEVRRMIVDMLQKQGIETEAVERTVRKWVAKHPHLSKEVLMDSVLQEKKVDPSLRYLIEEYHDGLLLFEMAQRQIWGRVEKDQKALAAYFKRHKRDFAWEHPRFKGYVVRAKSKKDYKRAKKWLKYAPEKMREELRHYNKAGVRVRVDGPMLVEKGDNRYVDARYFKGRKVEESAFPYVRCVGRRLKRPSSYEDVRAKVIRALQEEQMETWVNQLRKNARISMNKQVLKTINQHK